MKLQRLKQIIREEILEIVNEAPQEFGAFRRLVITTNMTAAVKKEIDRFMKQPNIKADYQMNKFSVKDGAKPGVIVVDMEGQSATGLSLKLQDAIKRVDKNADVKERKEIKLTK
jgi:hypothetical protein